jgi:Transcriptional regulators of sugar metabolism
MNEEQNNSREQSNTLIDRHEKIIEILKQNGSVSVSSLTEKLGVSEVTIRKDLSMLEQRKKLHRTHGGAILASPFISDRHVSEKEKQNIDEKQAIGAAAATHITKNDSILIASGTTVLYFAREIEPKSHLTVVTASVNVTSVLSQLKDIDVIQLGGIVRFSSLSVVGPFAEQMLDNFNCSKLFMGVDGIDLSFGLTTTNALEASLNKMMINCCQRLVVLADSTKFGRRGFSKICDLEAVDEIITDDKTPARSIQELEERGIKVTVVHP